MQTNLIGQTCRLLDDKGDECSLLHEVVAAEFSQADRGFVVLLKEIRSGIVQTVLLGPDSEQRVQFSPGRVGPAPDRGELAGGAPSVKKDEAGSRSSGKEDDR